jgi:Peptidase family M28
MRPLETTAGLAAFNDRGPGTDAERRAARWLAGELVASRHRVRIEAFWCRPNWALAYTWHVALALAGSLVSVSHPTIGVVLLAVALISTLADATIGISPGRRLSPEHASQNVLASRAQTPQDPQAQATTRLIVTANYDAGRTALIYRDSLRRTAAWLRRLTGGAGPGWQAWLSIGIAWPLAIAIVRMTQTHPAKALGALQLPPTIALVLALALLLEAGSARYGPGAGDNATGVATAIALTRALAADPPRNLTVELVLQGAGDSEQIGLRRHLRTHKHELRTQSAIVLGIAACGAGQPSWWLSDGRLVPLRYARRVRALAAETGATPHRGRGATPALPARAAGLSAIAIGCLDDLGLAPRAHQRTDTPDQIDPRVLDRALELGLTLAHAIDASLRTESPTGATTPA